MSDVVEGVRAGRRNAIARAITLVESTNPDHRSAATELLNDLLPFSGQATRVGISGVPGVGKSTFIDELGATLTSQGHRVAVLAVDPSSTTSHGSVLGDKTRMSRLAADDAAFIRPSPSAGTLGGVARATREAIVVLETAGYDVILVETVGVGQSEVAVAEMVDTFLFLTLARTGDQLQGIKRGILEIADVIAVNKADGEHASEARQAARELSGAIRMLTGDADRNVEVMTCSGLEGTGVTEVWEAVLEHRDGLRSSGRLAEVRADQQVAWMWASVEDQLVRAVHRDPAVSRKLGALQTSVANGETLPGTAADEIVRTFRNA